MDAHAEMQRLLKQLNDANARITSGQPLVAPVESPAPAAAPATPPVTAEQIAAIVETELKRAMPPRMGMVQSLDDFFTRALPPAELQAFKAYRDQGAPGLQALVASTELYPIAELLWDTIKEHALKAQKA